MEIKRISKKIVASLIVSIIILAQFSNYRFETEAAVINGNEKLYLALSNSNPEKTNRIGYAIKDPDNNPEQGSVIWNIVSYDSKTATTGKNGSNLYCIKAEYGQTWQTDRNTDEKVEYNNSYNVSSLSRQNKTNSQVVKELIESEYFNEILYLIDNMYIPEEDDKTLFLTNMGFEPQEDDDEGMYLVPGTIDLISEEDFPTDEDIVAVQQAAVWYYTNFKVGNNSVFNQKDVAQWLNFKTTENGYTQLANADSDSHRDKIVTAIYNQLLNKANQEGTKQKQAGTTYTLKNTTAKLWLSETNGADAEEQPIVEIHRKAIFDLALRKTITGLKDSNGNSKTIDNVRTIDVDTSNLYKIDTNTTAVYKHTKAPVTVETGDIVEYTFTIYNEGTQAGLPTEIKDRLPGTIGSQLTLASTGEITSKLGNIYEITIKDPTANIVTLKLKGNAENAKTIPAYNGNTLSYDEIKLNLKVEARVNTTKSQILTNIAYISEEYNSDTKTVIETNGSKDNDSKPSIAPTFSGESDNLQDGITYGEDVGYTGKTKTTDLNHNDRYYEGQEDDDDFEKIILKPQAFDLSLRKYITKVDNVTVNRAPSINASKLKANTAQTAEYNHRKDAVEVKDGSVVTYNISTYNEGSVDGIATVIKDQLPTGVKLNLSSLKAESGKYYLTSTKGNKYEVNYNEQTNEITFTLGEQKANLVAFIERDTLDQDTIEFTCTVNAVADETQNTYFTNIAYIYKEKTVDGKEITNTPNEDRDSVPYTNPTNNNQNKADDLKTVGNVGYTGNESNPSNLAQSNTYYKGQEDDDDFEKLVMRPKTFDLKLIKYITQVNGQNTDNRVLSVDMSKINTQDPTTGKQITTGDYKLQKNPVAVEVGDFVTYTFRVYNEGDYDGFAQEISENIPEGLEFILVGIDDEFQSYDGKTIKNISEEIKTSNMFEKIKETNSAWGMIQGTSIIKTDFLSKEKSEDNIIRAYNSDAQYSDGTTKNPDYKEISVIYRVKEDVEPNVTIKNDAAISKDQAVDKNGKIVAIQDRDSTPGNDENSWKKENSGKYYDNNRKWPIYQEDDEDYDNIITKSFDLSLRKQIVKINDEIYTSRYANLDATNSNKNTIYNYYDVNNNKPSVKAGDLVTYSIRVYNEGQIDGYAKLVADTLPSGLEFYSSTYNGVDYGWTKVEGTEKTYQTDFLSYEKDTNKGTSKSTLINAYTESGEADYKEIYIVCKVKDDVTTKDSLLNVAQIADDSDSKGEPVRDKDSIPGKEDGVDKWKVEDDLDIENLILKEFDLSLRKFITEIQTGETKQVVSSRNPVLSYENGQIKYTHSKDPLTVHVGDIVTYTLKVYNEGEIDGYAAAIKDDLPEYLEYLPDAETNKAYEWKMFDKDGKETTNVKDAVYVETEYLAKGHGEESGDANSAKNLLKAFDSSKQLNDSNPSHKEVKISFKVKDPNSNTFIITNFAQISEDTDANGNPVKDKDSIPNNGKGTPIEDDEDIENIKVEYFDLALLKYVTKVIVNENGKQTVSETGNVGDEKDIVPRVEINKKNINKTVVKFGYTIKVTNEGDIEGYAKEVTDYIPAGLEFHAEDNPNWKDEGNNVISTRALENTLLKPGESATVEVILTWINGQDNLGLKTNTAEISEDYNDKKVPDKDSTPDNKVPGEDDIDTADVLLSIKTGGGLDVLYVRLTIGLLVIILAGALAIKKFVL